MKMTSSIHRPIAPTPFAGVDVAADGDRPHLVGSALTANVGFGHGALADPLTRIVSAANPAMLNRDSTDHDGHL